MSVIQFYNLLVSKKLQKFFYCFYSRKLTRWQFKISTLSEFKGVS